MDLRRHLPPPPQYSTKSKRIINKVKITISNKIFTKYYMILLLKVNQPGDVLLKYGYEHALS